MNRFGKAERRPSAADAKKTVRQEGEAYVTATTVEINFFGVEFFRKKQDDFCVFCLFQKNSQSRKNQKKLHAIVITGLEKNRIPVIRCIADSDDFLNLFLPRQIDSMIWIRTWISGEKEDRTPCVEP